MSITRNNYEEYFILYMDNELDSEQRREVESFVEKNPDLKEELELLQQFRLEPDTSVVYRNKEELMSGAIGSTIATTPIEISNCGEWLVLYMDNELDTRQRKLAEHFIATEPQVKNEWNLLQRTRLQPETIVFAGKSSLYRTTEKARSIRQVFGALEWRVAAAVLLFLMAGSVAVILLNNRKASTVTDKEMASKQQPVQQKINPESPVVIPEEMKAPVNEPLATDNSQKNINPAPAQTLNNPVVSVKEKKDKTKDQLPVTIPGQVKKEDPDIVDNNNKPSNNLPTPEDNMRPLKKIEHADAVANNKKEFQSPDALTKKLVTTESRLPSDYVHTTIIEDDPGDGSPGDKKSKLRGILRKVTRNFEKRTNIDATDGEDRLLVAGLAIKLK